MYSGNILFFPKRAITGTTPVPCQSTTITTVAAAPTGYTDVTAGGGGVTAVMFSIEGGPVRFRADGTAPTSSVGTLIYSGTTYTWSNALYSNAQFIRDASATANATMFAHPVNV